MPGNAAQPRLEPAATSRTGPAAVVVCVHTPERLPVMRRALAAVADQLRDGDELVVVVDHHDELKALLAAELPLATVVANAAARGLSGARNTGVAVSAAPLLVFLDDDAVPHAGWLAAWRQVFADPEVMMAGGAVNPDWAVGAAPRWFPDEYGWVVGCDYRGITPAGEAARNPIGANMAVRRAALDRVGVFSAGLGRVGAVPAGCEETEIAIRIGYEFGTRAVIRTEGPAVDHLVPATRTTTRYFVARCVHEGRSKRRLSAAVGRTASLSSERRYVVRTLPVGFFRHLAALARGDVAGPARAAMVVAGLFATGWGYLTASRAPAPPDTPVAVAEVELAGGRIETPPAPASVLVRFKDLPVGRVQLTDGGPGLERAVADTLATSLAALLERAGMVPPNRPDEVVAAARACPPGATPAAPDGAKVTVVICTLGTEPRLRGAVAAALTQTHAATDVVVVDNDPASGRVARLLRGLDDPGLRVVAEPRRGLSWARNTGLAAATGTLVAFTDDDALPDRHWVAELVRGFALDPGIACVTGLVTPARLETRWERLFEEYGAFDKGYTARTWAVAPVADPLAHVAPPGERGPLFPYTAGNYGSGNNMAFRADLLRAVGGFDPALGAGSPARGGEDLDIFRAVLVAGHTILYTPSALVRHFHRDTGPALRKQLYGYGTGIAAVGFKQLVAGPGTAWRLLRKLPAAVRVIVDPRSVKYEGRSSAYPIGLNAVEMAGYLAGPWLLIRGRMRARRQRGAS